MTLHNRLTRAFEYAFGRSPTDHERTLAIDTSRTNDGTLLQSNAFTETEPTRVERELIEEQTGTTIRWSERLDVYEDYVSDVQPWSVSAETRALADLCLVLLNANEFLYVY